jgi:hypothetical protein
MSRRYRNAGFAQDWREASTEGRAALDGLHGAMARVAEWVDDCCRLHRPDGGIQLDIEGTGRAFLATVSALVRRCEERARRESLERVT